MVDVNIVVSGREVTVRGESYLLLSGLMAQALVLTGEGKITSGWDLRDADGKWLDPGESVKGARLKSGQTLYLSPVGGNTTNRKGDWFQTYTGKKFYPFDPRPDEVDIIDIAHSLSLQCRFNGHVKEFYSVAQHSIHVCRVFSELAKKEGFGASKQAHLCALLHDATEAYVGDLIRPIKIDMPQYKEMEEKVWRSILEHFGLLEVWEHFPLEPLVKRADNILLATERRDLLPDGPGRARYTWAVEEQVEPDPIGVIPIPSERARVLFTELFERLQ